MLQTEYEFILPNGYVDTEGTLHRKGVMRLATAADEILPVKTSRVRANKDARIIALLSRVIISLGSVSQISPKVIEGLYVADLAYLQELYNKINHGGTSQLSALCPKCAHSFVIDVTPGEPQ